MTDIQGDAYNLAYIVIDPCFMGSLEFIRGEAIELGFPCFVLANTR